MDGQHVVPVVQARLHCGAAGEACVQCGGLVVWLLIRATQREQGGGAGLMFLAGSIGTLVFGRKCGYRLWLAAGQVLLAASSFLGAVLPQRHPPGAYTVTGYGIRATAAVCLVTSMVLVLRSKGTGSRRHSRQVAERL